MTTTESSGYNGVIATRYRAGWAGLFTGENQSRAVQRVLADINERGLKCAGLVRDQWNPFVRLWWAIVAGVTLGFYVRIPNVLVVTEPMAGVSRGDMVGGVPGIREAARGPDVGATTPADRDQRPQSR